MYALNNNIVFQFQVNCRGQNAFGRRKRQVFDDKDASLSTSVSDYLGQLREEVTVQSNPILALERREERLTDPSEGTLKLYTKFKV